MKSALLFSEAASLPLAPNMWLGLNGDGQIPFDVPFKSRWFGRIKSLDFLHCLYLSFLKEAPWSSQGSCQSDTIGLVEAVVKTRGITSSQWVRKNKTPQRHHFIKSSLASLLKRWASSLTNNIPRAAINNQVPHISHRLTTASLLIYDYPPAARGMFKKKNWTRWKQPVRLLMI